MPDVRLIHVTKKQAYFAVRRFDRAPGNRRLHVHSFGNLIHANFRIPSTDYADLLKVTSILTRNHADVLQAFRRTVFNITAHNRDDHAKNFAFIMNQQGEWSLSPAYDLTYSPGPGGEHFMTVAGEGREPRREHILKLAREFEIAPATAVEVIEQVNGAIERWEEFSLGAGCTKRTIREIGRMLYRV